MSLPTLENTWEFDTNNEIDPQASTGDTNKRWIRTIKDLLTDSGLTQPWAIVASSDGVASGHDSTDRWVDDGDIVFDNTGNAHSWIVLRQTAIGTNFEMLINCNSSNAECRFGHVAISKTGFGSAYGGADGTTTAAPTASDQFDVRGTAASPDGYFSPYSGNLRRVVHCGVSDDGECTLCWTTSSNYCTNLMIIQKPGSPVTGWTDPNIFSWMSYANAGGSYTTVYELNDNTAQIAGICNSINAWMYVTGEGYKSQHISERIGQVNAMSSGWPMATCGVVSETSGAVGRHGRIRDLWWGSDAASSGDTYPADGSKQFLQIDDIIFPWDGSVPIIS